MATSESNKRASKKYNQANMKNGSYKLRIKTYESFMRYCQDNGTTANKLIKDFVVGLLTEHGYETYESTAESEES